MTFHKYLGDSKMFEYDKHYKECQQLNKPFIKARTNPKHKKYFVQIDLMTCDYVFTGEELQDIQKLVDDETKYLKTYSNSALSGFNIDKEIAWFDGISPEHVTDFCEKLYDITQKNHP